MNQGDQSLIELARFLGRSKWIVLVIIALAACAAVAYSFSATPMYRVEGSFRYTAEPDSSRGVGLGAGGALGGLAAGLGANLLSGNNDVQSALETIRSRDFAIRFVQDTALAPALYSERWNENGKRWLEDQEAPTAWDISDRLKRRLSVSLDGKSGLVSISVLWDDPEVAVVVLNNFVEKANSEFRNSARERTDARLAYLTDTLNQANLSEVKLSISELIRNEVERKMMINLEKEFAFRTVSPPVSPDIDGNVSPDLKKLLILAVAFGLFIGLLCAYAIDIRRTYRQSLHETHD